MTARGCTCRHRSGEAGRAEVGGEMNIVRHAEERLVASRRATPTQTAQVEIEEHEQAWHKPHRSWCRACVAGR